MKWDSKVNERFEAIIDNMLCDERLDLKATFTEDSLFDCEHFTATCGHARRADGYSLEEMNICHYAAVIGDTNMLEKVLNCDSNLTNSFCSFVKGKGLLDGNFVAAGLDSKQAFKQTFPESDESLLDDLPANYIEILRDPSEEIVGELAWAAEDIVLDTPSYVVRTVKVTPLHLAARAGDEWICKYLIEKGANRAAEDSSKLLPSRYLRTSVDEQFLKVNSSITRLFKILEPDFKLHKQVLPSTSIILHRTNYDLVYDTAKKVAIFAYQKLTKISLAGNAKRIGCSFHVDRQVPEVNRVKSDDYTHSGYQRGHLIPAADAVASDKAMEETFLYTNICPQNANLNQNYWKAFEKYIRKAVQKCECIEVFTGPLFIPQKEADGKIRMSYEVIGSGIAVPTHLFKVLYINGSSQATAYILPNEPIQAGTPYHNYCKDVDEVQKFSGILFNQWRPLMHKTESQGHN